MPVDPNIIFAKARMQRGVPALSNLSGFGSWANGVYFKDGLGEGTPGPWAAGYDTSPAPGPWAAGYDAGPGATVNTAQSAPILAIQRNPIPAAIALGVGVLTIALVIGLWGTHRD